jgi:hypothetical protein
VKSRLSQRSETVDHPGMDSVVATLITLVTFMLAAPVQAQIFAGADAGGAVVLSNFPGEHTPELVAGAIAAPGEDAAAQVNGGPAGSWIEPGLSGGWPNGAGADAAPGAIPAAGKRFAAREGAARARAAALAARAAHYRPAIERAALAQQLSPALLHAVIRVESGYEAHAVSRKGALGLMQLMPATARRLGVRDPFDPAQNIQAGARYLRELLTQFRGDLALALAAYNAGEAAVMRAGYRVPPYAETLAYVPRVLRLARGGLAMTFAP